jgi:GT2 family glycosyltransferase
MTLNNSINLNERISVGVSAYANAKTTKHCLRSILDNVSGDFELILVDDCSPDGGAINDLFQEFAKEHKNTKIFTFTKNLEYSGSLNCILSHAQGERIFFVSNDIFITPTYFEALLAVADNNPDVGIVRGCSNFVDNGKPTHNLDVSKDIKHYDDISPFGKSLYNIEKNTFFTENYLTGDAFLTKREVVSKIGTFDPLFYGYFADHDYGIRVIRSRYKLAVAKGAFAYHHQDANFNYLDKENRDKKLNARWAKVIENWARFKLKYGLPINLLYTSINDIDWDGINKFQGEKETLYIPPANYLEYLAE